jgi:hypothetical protein
MKMAKLVVGMTKYSIHKWKLWCTKNEVAIIGNKTIATGVSRQ